MGISLGISPTLANTIPYYAVILGVHLGPFPYSLLHYYIPLVIYGVQGSVHHMQWWVFIVLPKTGIQTSVQIRPLFNSPLSFGKYAISNNVSLS